MQIKIDNTFREFGGVAKKRAYCVRLVLDNCDISCTEDHMFRMADGSSKRTSQIVNGDELYNEKFGKSVVLDKIDIGPQDVYTPIDVDDEYYNTTNGLVNHNCSFLGSSKTLIDSECLEKLREAEPIRYEMDYNLKIFEDPLPGALYVMGVDPATGVGGDYAVIQVLKIMSRTSMEQVAVFRNNETKPGKFSRIIDDLCKRYNGCYFIVENQDVGKLITEEVYYTLENYKLLSTDGPGKPLGTRATKRSKLDACMELKRLMDSGFLVVHDIDTIKELSRFEEPDNSPNTFKASKGNHDDLVSGLYWAVYATLQPEIDLDACKAATENKIEEYPPDYFMLHPASNEDNFWSF